MSVSTNGGCSCGNLKYSFDGEPVAIATCHCTACRRSTSSAFSTSLLVPASAFHPLAGTPSTYTRQGDSGSDVTDHFCPVCGALIYAISKSAPGLVFLKAGSLDDLSLNDTKFRPRVEIYY
ncbi:hypothetical protein CEP54_015324 [Fusarium duplospermum]|uniref:CENP-V/GFA domain-containing protein n=1 Tax=Fusarium duplospermum TaxID=1325734 RepID=A0A428NPX9_9HYPO|nr:hypothetical protein CEP54_015324 [Fusarium duplospermum]